MVREIQSSWNVLPVFVWQLNHYILDKWGNGRLSLLFSRDKSLTNRDNRPPSNPFLFILYSYSIHLIYLLAQCLFISISWFSYTTLVFCLIRSYLVPQLLLTIIHFSDIFLFLSCTRISKFKDFLIHLSRSSMIFVTAENCSLLFFFRIVA